MTAAEYARHSDAAWDARTERTRSYNSNVVSTGWVLCLLALPYTNFPVSWLIGANAPDVVPLAFLPAMACVPLMLLNAKGFPYRWYRVDIRVAAFVSYAMASTLTMSAYLYSQGTTLYDITPVRRGVQGILSVLVGLCFYVIARWVAETPSILPMTLKYLRRAFLLPLATSVVHVTFIITGDERLMRIIDVVRSVMTTKTLSDHPVLRDRVSALTLEPSWAADQIVVLLLPVILAASRLGVIRSRRRWLFVSLLCLFFTFSRWGWIASATLLFLYTQGHPRDRESRRVRRWRLGRGKRLLRATALVVGLVIAGAFAASRYPPIRQPVEAFATYGREAYKFETWSTRVSLAIGAWKTFSDYPIFGTGLDNSGFFTATNAPVWSPIQEEQVGQRVLLKPKNLFLRLLAELGVIGFVLLAGVILEGYRLARACRRSRVLPVRAIGIAGFFGLTAFLIEGVSFDSLAFPNLWFWLGLVSGARYSHGLQVAPFGSPQPATASHS